MLPYEERVFNPSRETHRTLGQAKAIGPDTERLCQMLFAIEGRVGQRKLWGIVGLAERYPRRLVDSACARAIADGVHSYRHVKTLTEKLVADALAAIDAVANAHPTQLSLIQEHPLIQSADVYADLFARSAAHPVLPATIRGTHHEHDTEIERALRELRLSGIADTLNTRLMQAQSAQQPFLDTFAAMLQDELDRRRSRLTERRFKHSQLDERLALSDFDWRFNPKLPRQACFELHTLKFITEGANALIIGKPGTGKSHIAKAVAYQATLQGFDVRYVEADTEFARYGLSSQAEQAKLLRSYIEPALLVLDDLFLARRISEAGAELLQTIVHQRYKQRRVSVRPSRLDSRRSG